MLTVLLDDLAAHRVMNQARDEAGALKYNLFRDNTGMPHLGTHRYPLRITLLFVAVLLVSACAVANPASTEEASSGSKLVIYSGRSENLVGPIVQRFQEESGISVKVRWGNTAELATMLLEEGDYTPADLFFAQDPGGLGAVSRQLTALPDDILARVDTRFRDPKGRWVGISGRARVIVYNTERLTPEDLPDDLWGFSDPRWKGRMGWAPTNASLQAMVTAMRTSWGEEEAWRWLEAILANEPVFYDKNTPIVAAVGSGEIDVGFVNHYYLFRFLREEGKGFTARTHFLPGGGPGSLVMVAGAGVLAPAKHKEAAYEFLRFMLAEEAQLYFAEQTFEYPLVAGVPINQGMVPLSQLNAIHIDLADLADLKGTVELLREVGALP